MRHYCDMISLRARAMAIIGLAVVLIVITTFGLRQGIPVSTIIDPLHLGTPPEDSQETADPPAVQENPEHVIPDHPKYKPDPLPAPLIIDNFPLAAAAQSATDLPPIPPWNRPPSPHVPEKTPLFIGFTRNWRLLQQAVVSWITAGWPPEDIYVVENTGTMRSNENGLLSLQNPFYLNHTRLHMFGVNVIVTPTLFSFAQLQNFYLWTAIEKNYTTYFWGHMDVIAVSYEDRYVNSTLKSDANGVTNDGDTYEGFKSIYKLAVDALRSATSSKSGPNASDPNKPWAIRWFAYDRLALVNRAAFESVGGWDPTIPYYFTDCDMHDRLTMYGFANNNANAGYVYDVAHSLDDLLVLYRKKDTVEASCKDIADQPAEKEEKKEERKTQDAREIEDDALNRALLGQQWISDVPGSALYRNVNATAKAMQKFKNKDGGGGRNTWQGRQTGGKGEPYYRDPEGFDKAIQMTMQLGRDVYAEKWGHRDCGLLKVGRKAGDEWRVEHDWE